MDLRGTGGRGGSSASAAIQKAAVGEVPQLVDFIVIREYTSEGYFWSPGGIPHNGTDAGA